MSRPHDRAWAWMCAAVCVHLVVSLVHGAAHTGAHVPLSAAANAFVFGVVLAGPVAGLALTWPAARIGSWVVALTMAASLAFGVINHFVLSSPDHVSHVDSDWRFMFATTAVLLAVSEAAGAGLAVYVARERIRS